MGHDDDLKPGAGETSAPPLLVLTRQRTGAGEIFKMLVSHVARPSAGSDPLLPGQPFHVVAQAFQEGRLWELRRLVRQVLQPRPFFKYQYDVEPVDLSQQVFETLAECGYRALILDREDEAERIFSLAVCSHFGAWDMAAIDQLRRRARDGETLSAPSVRTVRALVRAELARRAWFDRVFPGFGIPSQTFTYEAIYRRGLGVLREMDRLFGFAGLPNREALVGDESLLRFTFLRGHYTLGVVQYSRALMEVYDVIREELRERTGAAGAAAPDGSALSRGAMRAPAGSSPE